MGQLGDLDLAELLRDVGLALSPTGLWVDRDFSVGARVNERVVVGWIDVTWPHPATPVAVLRDEEEVALDADCVVALGELRAALDASRQVRRQRARMCRVCGGTFVPGHMHDDALCQGCAERELGVVH